MGSTFTTFPDGYDKTSIFGTKEKQPVYMQFVPGVVVKVITGQDSINYKGDIKTINSIIAMPHVTNKNINKPSTLGDEFKYYPLLRGIQDVPTAGDPVMLCTIGNTNYYLGPLNTEGLPNFNNDKFKDNKSKKYGESSLESPLFKKVTHRRLEKFTNPKLDIIGNDSPTATLNPIHGDLIFEGRHGNSVRIGSRNINPYLIISNGRNKNSVVESSLDGTIMAMIENGSIRNHFNQDYTDISTTDGEIKTKKYPFTLADEEFGKTKENQDAVRTISKTFSKPLGSGRQVSEDDISVDDKIYKYNNNQFFLSSDRITFNARKESMFFSAYEHIHIGCGSSMTFSTSDNILIDAARSVVTNTPLFKVHSDSVYINGMTKVVIGNPAKNDNIQPAVIGYGLSTVLSMIIDEIKNLAYATSEAIENRHATGGSMDIMRERLEALDSLLGMEMYDDPVLEESYEVPQTLRTLMLSDKVFIKK
tara:strand:- start:135 stop:1562 length:1428 start_codon:yes stop_codon:yes gene_type:complete